MTGNCTHGSMAKLFAAMREKVCAGCWGEGGLFYLVFSRLNPPFFVAAWRGGFLVRV
jgi:hypothetical protein